MPRATAAEIARLLAPRSIAIIGASADPSKFSGRFVPYLQRHGYEGAIYPINARRSEIGGLACHADLASIPGDVDCVIYSAAAADVEAALAGCEARRVKLIVVTSAGFAERGDDEGRRLETALRAAAARSGARIIGPNCVGFLNAPRKVAAAAAAALEWAPPIPEGSVGVASQSGGLAMATIILGGFSEGIGFSHIVTTGNEADLDVADFTRFLVEDEATDAICLTLEAVRDGPAFLRVLEEALRAGKPVVALKSGKSELGKEMAASHTGALAGSHEVFAAFAARYGMCLVDDVDELYQTGAMFAKLRRSGKLGKLRGPVGQGCTALSVSGGHIGLLADLAALRGMRFPALDAATQARVGEALGKRVDGTNPVDMSGGSVSDPGMWGRCLAALLPDPGLSIGLPVLTVARNYDSVIADLIRVDAASDKPVVVTWPGGTFEGEGRPALQRSPLPLFSSPLRTAKALEALDGWLLARAAMATSPQKSPQLQLSLPQVPHPLVMAAVHAGQASLTERQSKEVLAGLGFPVTRERLAGTEAEACAFASELGLPVVLKGEHPGIAHKSEAGLVRLDLRSTAEVAQAFADIEGRMAKAAPDTHANGVLVQEMVSGGTEFVIGSRVDPVFGPVVMFGLGGIFVEVLNDVALAPAPLTHAQARALLASVRCAPLLQGARGRAPVDLDRLAALLVALGDFAVTHAQQVSEVDVNPLVAIDRASDNLRVLDALIVLHPPAGKAESP